MNAKAGNWKKKKQSCDIIIDMVKKVAVRAAFNKKMTILEALQAHPGANEVFVKHGMGCIACMGAVNERIDDGAELHGIDSDLIVKELNSLIEREDERK